MSDAVTGFGRSGLVEVSDGGNGRLVDTLLGEGCWLGGRGILSRT